MKTLEQEWEVFESTVLKDAGLWQRRSMRRAFYAGAIVVFQVLYDIGHSDESEEKGVNVLENLAKEFEEFTELVKNGGA